MYDVTLMCVRATNVTVEKAISIINSECVCVFVTFGIQNEMRIHHIVVCGLSASTKSFHIIS